LSELKINTIIYPIKTMLLLFTKDNDLEACNACRKITCNF